MDWRERGRGGYGGVHRCASEQYVAVLLLHVRVIDGFTAKFETRSIKWAPDGKGLVLLDKEVFCCAFEVEDGTES
jgi:hypothetical protein